MDLKASFVSSLSKQFQSKKMILTAQISYRNYLPYIVLYMGHK